MVTYAHKQAIKSLNDLDAIPKYSEEYTSWVQATQHLKYLQSNVPGAELIIYGSGPLSFIHTVALPYRDLTSANVEGLLRWNDSPFKGTASYVSGGGRDTMWIERRSDHRGATILDAAVDLLFGRTFEGWSGPDRNYFEINQEYAHLAEIHWREEQSAYCRYDENGDLSDVVSVSTRKTSENVALVTFTWPALEEYLSIAGYVLVRMFDFTLLRRDQFASWGNNPENVVRVSDDFLYRQKVQGDAAYTRGIQIIRPRDARTISDQVSRRWRGDIERQYVTFIAEDWRHDKKVVEISTDPTATTNYFQAHDNDLPFEVTPAFFRPEVLSKYKTDRDKYTVDEREISCRNAWMLRAYDVNDAGQVFAYICYLRALPYNEQLHWKSYNEEPKAPISRRALINDFKGDFVSFQHPREELLSILQRWQRQRIDWWTMRDEDLVHRANPPLTTSKDEWADAVMDLSKLVVEGFEVKPLRIALTSVGAAFDPVRDQSITLLEKLIVAREASGDPATLDGMRRVQLIRSKVKGHAGSSEGKTLAQEAIAKHGTYAEHFKHLCELIVRDLERVEAVLKP